MIILNLGAGVQSTTVLLLSLRGILPRIDHAIFADTQWEPKAVYEHLNWLESISDIPIHRVTKSNIKLDALNNQRFNKKGKEFRWGSIPYYTIDENGHKGMVRRQCTSEYKIIPIEKFIKREIMELKPYQRVPKDKYIDQWYGISGDELRRIRISKDYWRTFCYPLVGIPNDYLGVGWTRQMCVQWLNENYPERKIPRSACIGCPYHSNEEWRRLRNESPEEWKDAIEFDYKMRNCEGMKSKQYLHKSRVPLDEANLEDEEIDNNEHSNDFREECSGMCGV